MSPLAFLARPERWLWAIHRHRGTLSAAPNFAYELCLRAHRRRGARRARPELAGAWPSTAPSRSARTRCARFAAALRGATACGREAHGAGLWPGRMRRSGWRSRRSAAAPLIDRIQRDAFMRDAAVPCRPPPTTPTRCASSACGRPLPGHADPHRRRRRPRSWPSASKAGSSSRGRRPRSGYFRNPEADRAAVPRRLARLRRPRLSSPAARSTSPAASRTSSSAAGATSIRRSWKRRSATSPACARAASRCSAAPIRRPAPSAWWCWPKRASRRRRRAQRLRDAVSHAVVAAIGTPPDEVVLAPPHTVLKTSSGKMRRAACRELLRARRASARRRVTARRQVLRLALGAARAADAARGGAPGRRAVGRLGDAVLACWRRRPGC